MRGSAGGKALEDELESGVLAPKCGVPNRRAPNANKARRLRGVGCFRKACRAMDGGEMQVSERKTQRLAPMKDSQITPTVEGVSSRAAHGSALYLWAEGEPCPKCHGFKVDKPKNADGTPWNGMRAPRYDRCAKCNGSGVAPNGEHSNTTKQNP